jgi:Zn-dependent protease
MRQYDESPAPITVTLADVYRAISDFMTIEQTAAPDENALSAEDRAILNLYDSDLVVTFTGTLKHNSETAYEQLDTYFKPLNLLALFRENGQQHVIHVAAGRAETTTPLAWRLPLLLFIATIISVLYTGTIIAIGEIGLTDEKLALALSANLLAELWRGLPYAVSILLILGVHEAGHFLMARRHKTPASLPYFIPAFLLSPFGTFGAAILLRGTMRNRKVLFDIGAAGPLAGFIVALPILVLGLATSPVVAMTEGMVEGNSLLYALSKIVVLGRFLPDGQVDVLLNQPAWAGWTGLFVTALNLIPLGQLDGGHVLYALTGNTARKLYFPLIGFAIYMTLFVSSMWLVLALLLFLVGRYYAVPLDNITRLDGKRRLLAIITLILFVAIFTPIPLAQPGQSAGLLNGGMTGLNGGIIATAALLFCQRWAINRGSGRN